MNVYDLLNITGIDKEDAIIDAIDETKKDLQGLTTDQTCMIYSDYITRNLLKRHISSTRVNTSNYNFPYNHQFNLVPIDDKYSYLIDLCYKQFQRDKFNELLQSGYIIVNSDDLRDYLEIVGMERKDISLEDIYEVSKRKR